jgi:hypothetical protein
MLEALLQAQTSACHRDQKLTAVLALGRVVVDARQLFRCQPALDQPGKELIRQTLWFSVTRHGRSRGNKRRLLHPHPSRRAVD